MEGIRREGHESRLREPAGHVLDVGIEPAVLVHNEQVITYRLMDMGDQVYLDEISGSKLRPLSGSLGALFAVIGLAEIRSVRQASAEDGTSVSVNGRLLLESGPVQGPMSAAFALGHDAFAGLDDVELLGSF